MKFGKGVNELSFWWLGSETWKGCERVALLVVSNHYRYANFYFNCYFDGNNNNSYFINEDKDKVPVFYQSNFAAHFQRRVCSIAWNHLACYSVLPSRRLLFFCE